MVQVCFLIFIILFLTQSEILWFGDLFFSHKVGGSIRKQGVHCFQILLYLQREEVGTWQSERGCLLPVWCELRFHAHVAGVEIRNRWVLEASILGFRGGHLDVEYSQWVDTAHCSIFHPVSRSLYFRGKLNCLHHSPSHMWNAIDAGEKAGWKGRQFFSFGSSADQLTPWSMEYD